MEYIKKISIKGFTFSMNFIESLFTYILNYILYLFKNVFIYFLKNILEKIGLNKNMIKFDDKILLEIYNNLLNFKKYIPDIKSNNNLLFCFIFLYIFNTLYIITGIHNVIIFPSSFFYNLWFNNIFLLLCFAFYYGSLEFYDIFISKKNLSISIVFVSTMLATILMPKQYIIGIIFCIILIILNIFILINLLN